MTVVDSFLVSARTPSVMLALLLLGVAIVLGALAWSVLGDTLSTPHLAPTRWIATRIG